MTDEPSTRRPNRTRPGIPALDVIVHELAAADTDLREPVLERRVVHHGKYMQFEQDTVGRPEGGTSKRDLVVHPGAVAMLALDEDGRLLFVRQYRVAAGGAMLEIPAGTLDRLPDGRIEEPEHAAARELEEETAYRAGRLERLGGFWTAPGFSTEYLTVFIATDLRAADEDRLSPDEDERLQLARLTVPEAVAAIEAGLIEDAKSVAGVMWLARRLDTAAARG